MLYLDQGSSIFMYLSPHFICVFDDNELVLDSPHLALCAAVLCKAPDYLEMRGLLVQSAVRMECVLAI